MCPRSRQKITRAMRPRGNLLRTSHSSRPSEPTIGMPIGHENSTSLMSSPIAFRSSASRAFSHSRTGSRPLSDRKKRAGRRLRREFIGKVSFLVLRRYHATEATARRKPPDAICHRMSRKRPARRTLSFWLLASQRERGGSANCSLLIVTYRGCKVCRSFRGTPHTFFRQHKVTRRALVAASSSRCRHPH